MGYILVQPEVLRAKGINYFETIPDGRAIAEMRMLKTLGSISSVDVITSSAELKKLIADQIAAGITQPATEVEVEMTEDVTADGENTVTDTPEPGVEDVTDAPETVNGSASDDTQTDEGTTDADGSEEPDGEQTEAEIITDNLEEMTDGNE